MPSGQPHLEAWQAELARLRRPPAPLHRTALYWNDQLRQLRVVRRMPWWRQFSAADVRRMSATERASLNEQRDIGADGNLVIGSPSRDGRRVLGALVYERDRAWLHTRYATGVR